MVNKKIPEKTEEIILSVANVANSLSKKVNSINFDKINFDKDDISDLRIYLGYTKSFSDLAKVRLLYHKAQFKNDDKKNGKNKL